MWLTRLALRNPVFILMMSLMTVVLGFVSLRRLSVDLFPEINVPVIRVATFYTGAGPADIEKTITEPIERAVGASPGVDRVESQSRQGFSSVSVWFNYGVNLDNAQFEVSQRVAQILNTLPPGHPAAVHHQVRHHQHPRRPDRGQRRRAGRAAALRPRLQHDRAADRAHQRRRQRERRRRPDPRDRGQGEARRAAGARPRHPRRRRRGPRIEPAAAQRPHQGGRPRLQRLLEHAGGEGAAARRRDREGRGGERDRRRAGGRGGRARARRRRGRGRGPGPVRDRAHQRPARRLPARAQAAGREHHRGRRRDPRGDAEAARRAAQRAAGDLLRPVALHPRRRSARSSTRRVRAACWPCW